MHYSLNATIYKIKNTKPLYIFPFFFLMVDTKVIHKII